MLREAVQFSERLIGFATASHRRASLVLAVLALALFLPGFATLQPMDRDEPRFAQATKQMLESGDYVAIRFQNEARNKKPVGIYWMQAASVRIGEALGVPDARRKIWLYRIPSLLAGVLSVLLAYWTALALTNRRGAFLAAMLLASTVLIGVEARLGKTDATVLATVLAAMGAFARVYLGQGRAHVWKLPAIFWTAIGVGLLVKGPITPMIPLLAGVTLAVRDRGAPWLRRLKPLAGVLWCLLIVAPWFALIMIQTKGAFLADSVGADMLGKVQGGREAHGAPPLTYFAAFWGTAWPMAALALLAAPFAFAQRRTSSVAFLLAWLVPAWLLFEAVPTKLPHYVLPLYPAVAMLIALAIEADAAGDDSRWRRAALWLTPLVAAVLLIGAGGYGLWSGARPGVAFWIYGPIALIAALLAASTGVVARARPALGAVAALALALAVYSGLLTSGFARPYALSPRLAAAAKAAPDCPDPALATAGYNEPSLVFLTRTDLAMVDGAGAAAFLADPAPGCRIAFVDIRQEPAFNGALDATPALRESARLLTRVDGININGGRRLDIGVWVRQGRAR